MKKPLTIYGSQPSKFTEIKPHSHVFEWENALPDNICAEMIEMFEASPDQQNAGVLGSDEYTRIERDTKRSIDLLIDPALPEWGVYDTYFFDSLHQASVDLAACYQELSNIKNYSDRGYQIQKSGPGDFYKWHSDACGGTPDGRFLVPIWYLNDDFSGGHTEFQDQEISVKPARGKLIMFPPYWTHRHQGAPVTEGTKYIATTWLVHA